MIENKETKKTKELDEYDLVFKEIQIQLYLEYLQKEKNIKIAFKDIGPIGELLATKYNKGFVGTGSGGMGIDLYNPTTKKIIEVKTTCTIQNANCECGKKFNPLFYDKCPYCHSKNFKNPEDSRFSIRAKEFLNQYNTGKFENFTICHLSLVNNDLKNHKLTIKMEWYKIDFNDKDIKDIQINYFKNQSTNGKKDTCNLQPNHFDFYKLCPYKVDEKNITIDYTDLNQQPIIENVNFERNVKVPESVIPKYMLPAFRKLKTYKDGYADCKDFTKNLNFKNKSFGRDRGNTFNKKLDLVK